MSKSNIIESIMLEEDVFPKTFTNYIEIDFGMLFFNECNINSHDSNHAVIYKNKVEDLGLVLDFITDFYINKNIIPQIYQSVKDEGYFNRNKEIFYNHSYSVSIYGSNNFMVLSSCYEAGFRHLFSAEAACATYGGKK